MALARFAPCAELAFPRMPDFVKTARMEAVTEVKLYMELSSQRPIPPEVEGEPLSEAEQRQAWIDFEEKRFFRLAMTSGNEVMALHSPTFLAAELEQANSAFCLLLASAKDVVVGKIPELLS